MDSTVNTPSNAHEIHEQAPFARRNWCVLAGVCLLSALYAFGHSSILNHSHAHLPGVGLMLSTWAMLALCVFSLEKAQLRRSLFPLTCTLALSACYGLFANDSLRLMNLPVLVGLTALSAYSLAGGGDLFTASSLAGSLSRLFRGTLPHLTAPFRAARSLRRDKERSSGLIQGLLLCIPVVGIVVILLSDADVSFGQAMSNFLSLLLGRLSNVGFSGFLWNLVRFICLSLVLFAFIYGLNRWKPRSEARSLPKLRSLSLSMLLCALCAVYILFLSLQFRPAATAVEDYANSARAGFFQLVMVALIDMLVVLPALCIRPESRAVRILGGLNTLLTLGILVTALLRMERYIRAYGWTLLRAVTLWGILAIAVAMLAALIKCIRPRVKVCRTLAIFAVVSWIFFNYTNVDLRIAQANVAAWRSGALAELDGEYLAQLSPDVLPALQDEDLSKIHAQLEEKFSCQSPSPYDWSLSWLKVSKQNK